METEPLISVITVTYNAGKVIGKTMESLRKQSFKNYEWLVIDGNSHDDTVNLISQSLIPQLKLVSEPDNGLYDAMNKGLKKATGEYVIFLNAGDAFHDNATLAHYAEEAKKGKDIIYADTNIVDLDGNFLRPRHLNAPKVLTKDSFADGMLVCHQAFMVKKDLAPLYDLNFKFSADYDWCVKCISRSNPDKCKNLQTIAIDYLSDGLSDKNKRASLKERFLIMSRHYGIFKTSFNHFKFIFRALRRRKI